MKKTNQKNNSSMVFVSIESVIEKLQECNKKEMSTNNKLIEMLENTNLEKVKIELSRNGGFNRGSLVECIVKNTILNYLGFDNVKTSKSLQCEKDLNLTKRNKELLNDLELNNQDYEIKLLTSLARASKINEMNNCKKIIMIDLRNKSCGAYLVDKENLVLYTNCDINSNAYNSIKDYVKGYKLELLSELLGL